MVELFGSCYFWFSCEKSWQLEHSWSFELVGSLLDGRCLGDVVRLIRMFFVVMQRCAMQKDDVEDTGQNANEEERGSY